MKIRYIVAGIVQKGDLIILGRQIKKRSPYPGTWVTPGGGVEDVEKAKILFDSAQYNHPFFHEELRRELREELGVEVNNIHCIIPTYRKVPREGDVIKEGKRMHYYFLEYLCDYASGEVRAADDVADAQWFHKSDLSKIPLSPPSQEMYRELGWIQ